MTHSPRYPLALAVFAAGSFLLGGNVPAAHAQSHFHTAPVSTANPRAKAPEEQAVLTINEKLTHTVLPSIEFRQTNLVDAVEFLRQESRRLDATSPNPDERGVNIFVKLPTDHATVAGVPAASTTGTAEPAGPVPSPSVRVTLSMNRIPLLEALKYVATQAGMKVKIEPYAVSLVPLTDPSEALNTATFRVPPTFIPNASGGAR